ncbi:phosphoadenosine phosphosulfate reductase [Acidimangrovimonas sediminis]|uniref:phosphoadenosine phosphosulfate reductase n=1 Tax=Acidimangrovimonas sediminis TaxID=2056283 RepID=UPI000C7FBE82|nr:phosphoadenosine phosphosulfate reductase [Acidimangrovimonas sediminis]
MEDVRVADAAGAATKQDWIARVEEIGEEAGYFERLGRRHFALFSDASPVLLVSFEQLGAVRAGDPGQMPLGHRIAAENGWSSLSIIADGETWYRDPAVYGYFDRLVDDSFFEDFDRVVFFGAGMGGYGACAFSVASPGATVLALSPIATVDPALCGWDERLEDYRRLDFTSRYGYAPDMIDGADRVFLVYDPRELPDAMHAALFHRGHVTALPCPMLGAEIEPALARMEILDPIVAAACEGELTSALFYRLYRARRDNTIYLRSVLGRLERAERPLLAALLCRAVIRQGGRPRFRQRFRDLESDLSDMGIRLPPERGRQT